MYYPSSENKGADQLRGCSNRAPPNVRRIIRLANGIIEIINVIPVIPIYSRFAN